MDPEIFACMYCTEHGVAMAVAGAPTIGVCCDRAQRAEALVMDPQPDEPSAEAMAAAHKAIDYVRAREKKLKTDEIIQVGAQAIVTRLDAGPASYSEPAMRYHRTVVRAVLETAGPLLVEKCLNAYLIDWHELPGPSELVVREVVTEALR